MKNFICKCDFAAGSDEKVFVGAIWNVERGKSSNFRPKLSQKFQAQKVQILDQNFKLKNSKF